MTRRTAAAAALLVLTCTAAVVVWATGRTEPDAPTGAATAQDAPLLDADPRVDLSSEGLSDACRRWTRPLFATMRTHGFVTDVPLDELQRLVDLAAAAHQGCQGDDLDHVAAAVGRWQRRAPATFATDAPAAVSRRCAAALAGPRTRLARASAPGAGGTPALEDALTAASAALASGACTTGEQLAFSAAELWPAQRRAGVLATARTGRDAAPAAPFVERVRQVGVPVPVTPGCAAALAAAREQLSRAVGASMGATALGRLQRSVSGAASSGACTVDELDRFQRGELVPALSGAAR